MDKEKLKRILAEAARVVAAAIILWCIWNIVKTEVIVFQEDGPRFAVPDTGTAEAVKK